MTVEDIFAAVGEPTAPDRPCRPDPLGVEPTDAMTLPADFWEARPVLTYINDLARSRRLSPEGLLLAAFVRLASQIPCTWRIDVGLGPKSIALYALLVASSGAGKGRINDLARDLVPVEENHERKELQEVAIESPSDRVWLEGVNPSTGQGIAAAFCGYREYYGDDGEIKADRSGYVQVRHNVLIAPDEAEELLKQMARENSILGTSLRSAFTIAALGQANASPDSRRLVPPGNYVIGLLGNIQWGVAGPLFAEAIGGTPQRFLFALAKKPAEKFDGLWVDVVPIRIRPKWSGSVRIIAASREVEDLYLADLDEPDPMDGGFQEAELDSHRKLHLARLGALFALLDDRTVISLADFDLARRLWAASCAVRAALLESSKAEAARRAADAREAKVSDARAIREDAEQAEIAKAVRRRAAAWERVRARLEKAGGTMRPRALFQGFRSEHRSAAVDAIAAAIAAGDLTEAGGVLTLANRQWKEP